jgi:hypothetical protein
MHIQYAIIYDHLANFNSNHDTVCAGSHCISDVLRLRLSMAVECLMNATNSA